MRITTLDNQTIKWSPKEHRRTTASAGHNLSMEIVKEKWPTVRVLQEVSVPVRKGQTLFLDLYIPALNLAIEFQGEQHFKYTPQFHRSHYDFVSSKQRDQDKKLWCELNNINFVEFDYKDTEETMREKLDG
jgi:hypothetical protein